MSTAHRPLAVAALLVTGVLAQTAAGDGGVCRADLDGCGSVDVSDLLILLSAWGPNPGHPADLDGDGVVGGADLGYMLGSWGPCTKDLPMPVPSEVELVVVEITDRETLALGYHEFDVFAAFDEPTDELLNVYDANAACGEPPCFIHPLPGIGALPLTMELWELLGLTYDSFVTIGLQFGDGNQATLDPSFDVTAFEDGDFLGTNAGWFAVPEPGQGVAGNYPDNQVRIATFTQPEGTLVQGQLSITWRNGMGDLFVAMPQLVVGPLPCPWDCGDGDGVVGIVDLVALLGAWGDRGPCEFEGNDVIGVTDLVEMLSHWGPCP